MRKIVITVWALLLVGCFCIGQSHAFWQSRDSNYNVSIASGAGCSQATALLARMDGAQNTAAVTTAVCGMVTDGTWALLDTLYVFSVNSTTNALLNWVSSSFALTQHGSPTFSANNGYTGDGTAAYFGTGFNPTSAAGNYALDSASLGYCVLNNRTTTAGYVELGAEASSGYSYAQPLINSSGLKYVGDVNAANFPVIANTTTQGSWLQQRTSNSGWTLYKNGSSFASMSSSAGVTLTNKNITILAFNDTSSVDNFTADQLAYAYMGGGGISASAVYNRLHTYNQTVGETTAC